MRLSKQWLWKRIGERIRAEREELHMSQQRLASRVGLRRTTIVNAEAGKQRLTVETLILISKELGIPVSDLVKGF